MSSLCPPVVVDLNEYTPLKYGLKSVSRPFPDIDSHWQSCGVQFQTWTCAQANQWVDSCESIGLKADPPEPVLLNYDPVTIYSDWLCGPLGQDPSVREQRSRMALDCAEDREIEDYFYTTYLTDGSAAALNTDLTPMVLPTAIGALEAAMALANCGTPTIHAPREIGELAAAYHLTYGAGSTLNTALGSPWVFGSGYGNTDPDGVPAPAGVVWIYATGPMYLQQSEVFMTPPTFEDALNRTNNTVRWEASRTSLVGHNSCVTYAVAITTAASSGGGGGGGLLFPSP